MTVVFADGFEACAIPGNWDVFAQVRGAAACQATIVNQDSFAGQFWTTSNLDGSYALVLENLAAAYALIYERFFFYLPALPDSNSTGFFLFDLGNQVAGTLILWGVWRDAGGNYQWYARRTVPAPVTYYYSPIEVISAGRWYCAELGLYVHNTAGWLRIWIDEDIKINQTGIDTDDYGNMDRVSAGIFLHNNQISPKTAYVDCAEVSTTRINCKYSALNPEILQAPKIIME